MRRVGCGPRWRPACAAHRKDAATPSGACDPDRALQSRAAKSDSYPPPKSWRPVFFEVNAGRGNGASMALKTILPKYRDCARRGLICPPNFTAGEQGQRDAGADYECVLSPPHCGSRLSDHRDLVYTPDAIFYTPLMALQATGRLASSSTFEQFPQKSELFRAENEQASSVILEVEHDRAACFEISDR